MSDKPILFCGEMVRAKRDGRKTQTRRLRGMEDLNGQPCAWTSGMRPQQYASHQFAFLDMADPIGTYPTFIEAPYAVGDYLWTRETWAVHKNMDSWRPCMAADDAPVWYRADSDEVQCEADLDRGKWRPSIFMPRWAARDWSEVTDVRVQRVQEISEADAIAEGISFYGGYWRSVVHPVKKTLKCWPTAVCAFGQLWDSINAKPKRTKRHPATGAKEDCYVSYPWTDIRETRQHRGLSWYVIGNPWVAAYTFRQSPVRRVCDGCYDGGWGG